VPAPRPQEVLVLQGQPSDFARLLGDQTQYAARHEGVMAKDHAMIGLYPTRKEAVDAFTEFVKLQGDSFRAAYDDCIVELVLEAGEGKLDT
jgi:hypothetical protein